MPTRREAIALFAAAAAAPSAQATGRPADPATLVAAARRQIGVTTGYDRGYHVIGYPNGDLPRSTGVCADVVVRAARDGWGLDLQRLVHEDMGRAFKAYPQRWGLRGPDANIDHRRVPNLATYLARAGAQVWHVWDGRLGFPQPLAPGDIVTWRRFLGGGEHVALVSAGGLFPQVIQNYGWGVHEEWLTPPFLIGTAAQFRWRPSIA